MAHEVSNNDNAECSETKQLCAIQFTKESIAILADEIVALKKGIEDFDEVVEVSTVNDLCYDEDAYAQTAALNLGAHIYASVSLANAGDQISTNAQIPAATKSETSQPSSAQFSDLCQEEYWTAAGLGFKTSADRHAATLNNGAHMYVRDDPNDANDRTKECANT